MKARHILYAALVLFGTEAALAAIDHPILFPLGDQEGLLANTSLGLRSSATGFFFNPASLTGSEHSRVAVSASTYVKTSVEAKGFIRNLDGRDLDYSAGGFQTIPSAVASSRRLTDSWYIGFGAFVPESMSVWNQTNWETTNFNMTIFQIHNEQDLRLGGALAYRAGDNWSLGFGLYASNYTLKSHVSVVLDSRGTAKTSSTQVSDSLGSVWGAILQLGAQYHPSREFTLGLRLSAPTFVVKGSLDQKTVATSADLDTDTISSTHDATEDPDANYRFPPEAALGLRWAPTNWFAFLSDVTLIFPMSYKPLPNISPTEEIGFKFTPHARLGFDWTLSPSWSIKNGFLWSPTAISAESAKSGSQLRETFFGATAGFEWTAERIRSGFGGFYIWGNGENPPLYGSGDDAVSSTKHYGVLLTTSYQLD